MMRPAAVAVVMATGRPLPLAIAALSLACLGATVLALPSPSGGAPSTYRNPLVHNVTLPDPGLLVVPGGAPAGGPLYVVVTTSGNSEGGFPIRTSSDLVNWTRVGFVFPNASADPAWGVSDFWAPEVHPIRVDGRVVSHNAYYAARGADGMLAVGVAVSTSGPTGPFLDTAAPLVHNASMGNIDPTFFVDADGSNWLIWKEDGNAVGKPTPIWAQQLDASGTKLVGAERHQLIRNTLPWEGILTEAPWMVLQGGEYYLFYSGNINANYAVGVARASALLGPYTKRQESLLSAPLNAGKAYTGPGHCSVVENEAGTLMMYHAWQNQGHKVNFGQPRFLMMDAVDWNGPDGFPTMSPKAPSADVEPIP